MFYTFRILSIAMIGLVLQLHGCLRTIIWIMDLAKLGLSSQSTTLNLGQDTLQKPWHILTSPQLWVLIFFIFLFTWFYYCLLSFSYSLLFCLSSVNKVLLTCSPQSLNCSWPCLALIIYMDLCMNSFFFFRILFPSLQSIETK